MTTIIVVSILCVTIILAIVLNRVIVPKEMNSQSVQTLKTWYEGKLGSRDTDLFQMRNEIELMKKEAQKSNEKLDRLSMKVGLGA